MARVLCLAIFFLTGSVASAAAHAPILINGDSPFTAANGVTNPSAAGTAADPYLISNWTIDGGGNYCVQARSTTKHFELRNIECTNAAIGIFLLGLNNGKILDSSIPKFAATLHSSPLLTASVSSLLLAIK